MLLSREPALDVSALNGVRVLVVEDSWHVAKAMKRALELLGMHVIGPTTTTAEARRLTAAQKPRLALVDVNLKQETACGLINELHGQGIQVVVVSGYASIPVAKDRVAGYLQKPFTGTELIRALGAIVHLLH
jgi:DNA-binding NtrC family response regulator